MSSIPAIGVENRKNSMISPRTIEEEFKAWKNGHLVQL
jgi:hypothetical protein